MNQIGKTGRGFRPALAAACLWRRSAVRGVQEHGNFHNTQLEGQAGNRTPAGTAPVNFSGVTPYTPWITALSLTYSFLGLSNVIEPVTLAWGPTTITGGRPEPDESNSGFLAVTLPFT